MSYGFHAFAIDLGIFRHVFRSKDDKLVLLLQQRSPELREPAAKQALVDLIYWNPLDPRRGGDYAIAFERLCNHFGEFLHNDKWMPIPTSWPQDVDAALGAAGVPPSVFTMYQLWGRGNPFKVPPSEDFPYVGYLRLAELSRVDEALSAANYGAIRGKPSQKTQLLQSIDQVREWVRTCLGSQTDLVCFFL